MRIGELLVMNGLITEEQLEKALKQQAHSYKKLGEILIENKLITERQLVEALEFQLGIPVVNMDEVVLDKGTVQLVEESIARRYGIVPIEQKNGKIKVAMIDPLNQEAIKAVQVATGMIVQPCIATRIEVEKAIIDNYGVLESVKELTKIIEFAFEKNASDIHFSPQQDGLEVKYRIENELQEQKTIPKNLQESVIGRIKTLSGMNTSERNVPQSGRIHKQVNNKNYDIRISTLPTVEGESVVLRIMDQSEDIMKLSDLGFSEDNLKKIEKANEKQNGLTLITGPALSGKTTTLYSLLSHLNDENQKVITIEDPVERRIEGITQVETNEQSDFTFAKGLQSIVNQDPNIVVLGDIPNADTAEAATRVSLSGRHLIGSIHGTNALKTIRRLIDMDIEPYLIASSLSAIVAQRVIRRVCDRCAHSVPVSDEELKLFEENELVESNDQKNKQKSSLGNFRSFVTTNKSGKMAVIRGDGCMQCNNTGYHGYLGVQEVLVVNEQMREMIVNKRPMKVIEQHLKENGFKTMLYDGLLKAREGLTTVEEVMKVVH
ncbi:GspE/PulE family protein [Alkalihalobacillus sp. AL-G]|uniref:GspE/PulE family protein n=1 Tax=Alkalihalobacillus sp. AL-G TaxID=2926399 RepID=UPI0027297E1D|nr:GspE/PulE family protein [Alkalihalobacillus sp. AL-G]WLD91681.1 GspE/PulE family protein [Alkalihalobacillus sp. AL-G]